MPNRILKESIHDSEKVNSMTDFQFRLWVNLITYVDDYGRGDARPAIIKGKCFPLRDRLTNSDIEAALIALAGIGCVGLYEVDGKPYLYFPNWQSHQTIRNKKSKYPAPSESNCLQMHANDRKCPRNPIQSNPIRIQSESESNTIPPNPPKGGTALSFDEFWKAFPKKKDKGHAEKAFAKVSEEDREKILSAIERQKKSEQWKRDGGKFIPYPATWLNGKRWEDAMEVDNATDQPSIEWYATRTKIL